uniref:Mos1 transposase HTH domain-containing protein n=1 Tax=Lygus hesperus TaxID=30085 RepID=A0A0A9X682_LYGHE
MKMVYAPRRKRYVADVQEQRAAIKFCFLLGKSAAETFVMLQKAYDYEALSKARVYDWFSRFKRGDMTIESPPLAERSIIIKMVEKDEKINTLVREDRQRRIAMWLRDHNEDFSFQHNTPAHTALSPSMALSSSSLHSEGTETEEEVKPESLQD